MKLPKIIIIISQTTMDTNRDPLNNRHFKMQFILSHNLN